MDASTEIVLRELLGDRIADQTIDYWPLIKKIQQKIDDANSLIEAVDLQLIKRYRSLILQIEMLDNEVHDKFEEAVSRAKADYKVTSAYCDQCKKEMQNPDMITQTETLTVNEVDTEELDYKQIFRKIAGLTHPDKGNGNADLFARARKAYKSKDLDLLMNLLAEASINPKELFDQKLKEYQILINGKNYKTAQDWSSGKKDKIEKIDAQYRDRLMKEFETRKSFL